MMFFAFLKSVIPILSPIPPTGNRPKIHNKTSEEELNVIGAFSLNPRVLITRLPDSYVIKLCEPVEATQFGKVGVKVSQTHR